MGTILGNCNGYLQIEFYYIYIIFITQQINKKFISYSSGFGYPYKYLLFE